jgi:hypothetical protein
LFCDYHLDKSQDPYAVNKPVLEQVTGEWGVLDVINSGSVTELDPATITHLQSIVISKKIMTLWSEAHYAYREKLPKIREKFAPATCKFRTGIESFKPSFRIAMNKGIEADVTPEQIRKYFDGVCLLVCVEGQTRHQIEEDIHIAMELFEYFSVNVFTANTTSVKQDPALTEWFLATQMPKLEAFPNCEVLVANTDLGVG